MIPLKDSTKARNFPIVNITLIIINIAVFAYQLMLNQQELIAFVHRFGVIPQVYTTYGPVALLVYQPMALFPLFTSMFVHGSFVHIIGNMLYLWVFGDNIEDKLGKFKFIMFYFAAGLIGNFAHIAANPTSAVPTIGASGAVAGVLGAYFLAFPRAKVLALVPIGFFLTITTVPAILFLVLWFFLQLISGLTSIGAGQMVAWWAHIGGFVAGASLWLLLKPENLKVTS
ncbi:MAG: rhomboid family intramembrane serine protease [Bacillota bacterium]